jgi:amino acid adenylation domain-containing protein
MRDNHIIGNRVAAADQNLEARDYWLNKLAGEPVKSTFPCDYIKEKKPGQSKPFETISFGFAGELFERLMKLSNGFDYSLHMILVAGVTVLVEKYTGSKDIILGAPIYKQEVNASFINTILAIRNNLEPHMTFKELLMQVRQTFMEATKNQNYPIETLLYQLGIESAPDEFPLFDIAVLLENIHDKEYMRHIPINMFFSFRRTETGLTGKVEYNPLLYDGAMIDRIILHFKHFMQTALFNVDVNVEAVEILSEDEKRQLMYDFNDTRQEYPGDKTLVDLFAERARRQPEAAALWFAGKRSTYGELDQRSHCLSRLLVQKGVKPGTIVGLMVERSFEMVTGMLGILRAGGAYLPLDCQHPEERIKYILSDSGAELLLGRQHLKDRLTIDVESIDLMDETIYSTAPVETESERAAAALPCHLAYVIYTSGSTGKAKGVAVEHGSIVNTLLWRKGYYDFNPTDVILQILGFTFDSSVEDIFTTLISGGALVLVPPASVYDLQYLKKLIMETGVTYFLIVPGFYKSFLEEIPDALKGLRAITVAADNITEKLVKRHFQLLEHVRLYNEYGPTENSVCSTVYEFGPTRTNVLIGKPIHNVTCYILNTENRLNPIGVPGELCVSGKGLARGYWKRPQLSKEKFVENPFFAGERMYRTGDLAKWLPDGNIEFLGRIDYQVKLRGFRIELGEIESQLLKYEGIKEAVVTAVAGASEGEKYLCAYIVPGIKLDESDLRDTLLRTLPEYMIPTFFIQLEQMPLTPNGKIDRKALPKPEAGAAKEYIAPRDLIEEKMVDIWSQVLKIEKERLGINANFFDSGGHSLKATVLVSRIHKEFNARLPVAKIFETPTVRGLAEYIKRAAEEAFTSIQPTEEKDYYALSPAQKRLYILQQMDPESKSYNLPMVVMTEGKVDRKRLSDTFRKLIARHDSLRTSFTMVGNKPVQGIHDDAAFEIEYHRAEAHHAPGAMPHKDNITSFIRPFDLSRAPLLRVGLIYLEDKKHVLMLDMHHIISDGVSMELLIKETGAFYAGEELPPCPIQYKDYSECQNSESHGLVLKKQEEYWKRQFKDDIPHLKLPTDHPRPAIKSVEGDRAYFNMDGEKAGRLKALAREEDVTLYMLLLAIFNVLLFKLSGQEDIIVGTDAVGREHIDLQHVIGIFINTLALRNHPAGEKKFSTFLLEIKGKVLEAFDNQDFQFEQIVEQVVRHRDLSRNPLFDVAFFFHHSTWEHGAKLTGELSFKALSEYEKEYTTAKFDLALSGIDTGEALLFSIEYCTKLFKREKIESFIILWEEIVSAVLENRHIKPADIKISHHLLAAEEQEIQFDDIDF